MHVTHGKHTVQFRFNSSLLSDFSHGCFVDFLAYIEFSTQSTTYSRRDDRAEDTLIGNTPGKFPRHFFHVEPKSLAHNKDLAIVIHNQGSDT
jgi:hypothetical protein